MKVLITGGSGYFGTSLAEKIIKQGHECILYDLEESTDRHPQTHFIRGDIRESVSCKKAFSNVDMVFHAASVVPLTKDRGRLISVNVKGTETVLRAALEAKVKKVIYISSSAVFGIPKYNPVTADVTPTPMEAYGQSKWEAEKICETYLQHGLDISIIRPRTVIGPGRLGIFQILFEWIYEGYNIPVFGRGDNIYQYIHAEDLSEAAYLAAFKTGFFIYHCGTDRFGTMREGLEYLCAFAKTGSCVKSVPMSPVVLGMKVASFLKLSPLGDYHSLMYGRSLYFDISDTKKKLGWVPKYSNNEMLIEAYQWYTQHRQAVLQYRSGSHQRSAVKEGVLGLVKRCL